jgi:hypothetical protein
MKIRNLVLAGGAVLALTGFGAAQAATEFSFGKPGDTGSIYLDGFLPGTTKVDDALGGLVTFTLKSIDATGYQWTFGYHMENLSTEPSRLATLGWDVSGDLASAKAVSGVLDHWATNGNIASIGDVDFCLKSSGGANCSGGGGGGVSSGASGDGGFSLVFRDSVSKDVTSLVPKVDKKGVVTGYKSVTTTVVTPVKSPVSVAFSDFAAHYQSLPGGKSTVGIGAERIIEPMDPVSAIPEPATWTVMLIGVFGIGGMLRRRGRLTREAVLA